MTDTPMSAAQWLWQHHPDLALPYAERRALKHIATERGPEFWSAVLAHLHHLKDSATTVVAGVEGRHL